METLQVEPLETMVGRSAANARRRRTPAPFSPWWALVLLISDVGMFVFSAFAVALVRFGGAAIYEKRLALGIATMILIAFWIAFFIRLGLYRRSFASSFRDEFYYTLAALAIGVAPLLIVFTLVPAISPSRSALLELFAVAAVGVSTARAALHALRTRWALQSARRIAIVGVPERVASVVQELLLTSQDEVLRLPIADFDERLQEAMAKNQAVTELDWIRAATAWGCDTLIATEALPPSIMPTILRTTEPLGIKFAFAPTRFRPQAYDFTLQKDGGLALICPRSLAVCTPQVSLVRRIIDLALVVPAIVLLSPLLAAVALLVYLDSGTPIIYRQTRVGLHGHEFEILKFRSMPLDVEKTTGPVWADPNRQRVTRIGGFLRRASLDELPQLFNVLRGEMTLVGPRPERPFYVEKFRRLLPRYDERNLVRPGITGWSQVNMKRVLSPADAGEKLAYDLFYIEHWSLFMDASIVVKTLFEFLFHRAA